MIILPEYVPGRWWEHLLHNQSALRLKARLLFQPQVMVTNVPWLLDQPAADRRELVGSTVQSWTAGPAPRQP